MPGTKALPNARRTRWLRRWQRRTRTGTDIYGRTTILQQFGIEEVDPQGEPFDPELHEAISMRPSEDLEPGSVVTVVQKGYTLNGRLLRPAMVIVAAEA